MSECPLCHAPVPDDFGLIECNGCGSPLIVHMDGRVEVNGSEPVDAVEAADSYMPVEDIEAAVNETPVEGAEEFYLDEPLAEPVAEQIDDQPEEFEPDFMDSPTPPASVYQSAANESPDLSDVANFGNSDLSGGREGSLRYTLFIEGIDTSDVRESFREALTDRKLMWDTDQILRSIRHGSVNIPNVSPNKAHVLISRLRGMPVSVRWEQYAISQT